MTNPATELADLDTATERYEQAKTALEAAQEDVIAKVVAALRAGEMPTVVAKRSPFTEAYVRKIARDHNIPPAKPGKKPSSRRATSPQRPSAMRTK